MSASQLVLPAVARPGRAAAVRQHSSSSAHAGEQPRLPRPAPAVAPPSFFASAPRPKGEQLAWRATLPRAIGPGGVGTGTPLGTPWGTRKRRIIRCLRHSSHCSQHGRARMIRAHTRACGLLSLSLGTWERRDILLLLQEVGCFLGRFQRVRGLGTWERTSARRSSARASGGRSNKIEGGYAFQQSEAAGAGEKFRASIAPDRPADLVVQGEDLQQLTRRGGNGGFAAFPSPREGHVGRVMLEGRGQAAAKAGVSGTGQKLRQLAGLGLVRGSAQLLELAQGSAGGDRGEGPPGSPNAAAGVRSMLALDVDRIWIEHASERQKAACRRASSSDRQIATVSKSAQFSSGRRGPGGICASNRPLDGRKVRQGEAGRRAGVNFALAVAQPHEAGEVRTLRQRLAAVKGLPA